MKLFKNLKYLTVALIATFLAVGASVLAVSGPTPPGGSKLDSTLGVLNRTQGQVNYSGSVNGARVDDVINVQVWYHNTENADSGKVANDVNVKVSLPGAKEATHTITSTVKGTNTNYDTQTATVSSVIPTNLSFVTGSAVRRFNSGTNANPNWITQPVPDSIVGSGFVISRMQPCWNFQESIILQVRLTAPVISIVKQVKVEGAIAWVTNTEARPGDTLAYLITVKNEGNTTLNNVVVRDSLPPRLTLVPGSVMLYNANHRSGISVSDNVINGGINIGNYTPGSDAKIRFQARVPERDLACGMTFTNVGVTKADTLGEFYNTAITTVPCRTLEDVRIRVIKFNDTNASGTRESFEAVLSGWQFRVTGPNTNVVLTTDESGTALLTALQPGRYTVTEINKAGWENTTGLVIVRDVTSDAGTQTFMFGNRQITTPPGGGELPSSGPADAAMPFAASLGLSGGVIAWIRSKKNLLDSFRK